MSPAYLLSDMTAKQTAKALSYHFSIALPQSIHVGLYGKYPACTDVTAQNHHVENLILCADSMILYPQAYKGNINAWTALKNHHTKTLMDRHLHACVCCSVQAAFYISQIYKWPVLSAG